MSIPGSASPLFFQTAAGAAAAAGPIKSVRFNDDDSAYLNFTPSSAGNRKTFTYSGWIKRCSTGTYQTFFSAFVDSNNFHHLRFRSNETLETRLKVSGSDSIRLTTTQVFRDFSAWLHVVFACDTTQTTAADRAKLYVNGTQITDFSTETYPSLDDTSFLSNTTAHYVGRRGDSNYYHNGYMADVYFIDGQALDPTSFGAFDDNGVWQAAAYSGTYGTNGFHLFDFANESGIGNDSSGNDNDWTVNNISTFPTAGPYVSQVSGSDYNATYSKVKMFDSSETTAYLAGDSSTVTWTITNGLAFSSQLRVRAQGGGATGTITFNWSGGSYDLTVLNAGAQYYDVTSNVTSPITSITWTTGASAVGPYVSAWEVDGSLLLDASQTSGEDVLRDVPTNGTQSDTGAGGEVSGNYCTWNPLAEQGSDSITLSNGNLTATVGSTRSSFFGTMALEGKTYWEIVFTGGAYVFGMADASMFNTTANTTPNRFIGETSTSWGIGNDGTVYNNGASQGTETSWTNGDVMGWSYDSSNGAIKIYKNGTLNGSYTASTANTYFPAATLLTSGASVDVNFGQRPFAYTAPSGYKALCTTNLPDPTIADGSDYFDIKTWDGNGSTQTISGLEMSPDWLWIKTRSTTGNNDIYDSVRGVHKYLNTDSDAAEVTNTEGVTSFNSDGWTMGSRAKINLSGRTYVGWAWDAGSSTVSNTDGSITSSVRANQTAGFSIVSYTGVGTVGTTIGHGLNAAPEMIIIKNRDVAFDWVVGHQALDASAPWDKYLRLNETDAVADSNVIWNDTAPTSSVFTVGGSSLTNDNTEAFIAYCFAPVAGYSAFGSFTTNGSADGPFTYTGFRPAFILYRYSNTTGNWAIFDSKRNTYNVMDDYLFANTSAAEASSSNIDFLSNGFKFRISLPSGNTIVFACFAENPFQANGGLAR